MVCLGEHINPLPLKHDLISSEIQILPDLTIKLTLLSHRLTSCIGAQYSVPNIVVHMVNIVCSTSCFYLYFSLPLPLCIESYSLGTSCARSHAHPHSHSHVLSLSLIS